MATQHHRIPYTPWSRPRSCYRRDGKRKRRYPTREAAEHQARRIEEIHCVEMTAYLCRYCGWHHVGHERQAEA